MGGPSAAVQNAQTQQAQAAAAQSKQATAESAQLYGMTLPGLDTAVQHYSEIASGNPQAIFAANAPAVGQINAQAAQAQQAIQENVPRGGAQELALAELPAETAGQIGTLATTSYEQSFPALANLASGTMSASQGEQSIALNATNSAATSYGNIAEQQAQGKASTMGFLSSAVGGAASLGTAGILHA